LFQGIALAGMNYGLEFVFHSDLVIGLLILVLVLSNGGFHLDGLSDTFDALAVKSSDNKRSDRQKRLDVMKDAAAGPIGVTALIFALGLKYLTLKNISHLSCFTYYSSLIMLPVLPKWTMVISMFHGKAARQDGLGRIFLNGVRLRDAVISTLMLIMLFSTMVLISNRFAPDSQYLFCAALLPAMYIFCRLCINFFDKKFGGLTGDILGAISEFTEILFLLMVIIWSRLYI
ncbi:MAG: adenosylcobinamide-GDP ribazoletransferase, partial [Nitrospirae bacterium]|nr:adenosylcobinamide-GDP ribazoletransferase [Nitrospirota bacterium]